MKKRGESYFGLHFDLHPKADDVNLGADLMQENIENLLRRVRPDYVTYDCKGHEGYCGYPSEAGVSSPGIVKDSLSVWRKATQKLDISLGIHYSGLQDFIQAQIHPECCRMTADGKTDGKTMSVFSDYPDRLLLPQLKEAVKKYGVNGVWLDAECWGAQPDYSAKAIAAWKQFSGTEEVPADSSHPLWQKFKEFHRRSFERYLTHWTEAMKRVYPDVDRCSNWAYTTMMPKEKQADVSMISGDFDPFLSLDRARTECRYLENVGFSWELQSWGFDLVDGQGPCRKAKEQIEQEAGVVVMHGGGYMNYFLPTRGGYLDDGMIETLEDVADFVRAREELSHFSKPIYEIGVLYPSESQLKRSDNVYAWWGNRLDEVEGALHALLENRYSVTILAEHHLKEKLSALKCLVVPECDTLGAEYRREIEDYVKRGGKLLVLGPRAAGMFSAVLQVETFESASVNTAIAVDGEKIQANGEWAEVKTKGAEQIYARYSACSPILNSEYLDVRDEVSEHTRKATEKNIAATLARFGKGLAAGVYTDFGKLYFKNHHMTLRSMMRRLLEFLEVKTDLTVTAPPVVDVSLRQAENGNLTVHLLNTCRMPVGDTRKFCDYIPKITDISVKVKCPYPPEEVVWMPGGRKLEFTCGGGEVETRVEELEIHGIVELRRKKRGDKKEEV